jgi:plasmid stability protein
MPRKTQDLRAVMTRLPEALCRRLEREAAREGRSMNAEIIHRLQQSFRASDQASGLDERVRRLEEEIFRYASKPTED